MVEHVPDWCTDLWRNKSRSNHEVSDIRLQFRERGIIFGQRIERDEVPARFE
jgi:hypothetical protein